MGDMPAPDAIGHEEEAPGFLKAWSAVRAILHGKCERRR
jgi:hypothetical protein